LKKNRLERVNSLLKEVISEVIHKDVKNPHITTFISVTLVETSADLHHATVSISLIASDTEKAKILNALQTAAGFIAVNASKKVELRYFPKLVFKLDKSLEEHMRIHEILGKIEHERNSRPEATHDGQPE
jgi:ribosome-binding factor A